MRRRQPGSTEIGGGSPWGVKINVTPLVAGWPGWLRRTLWGRGRSAPADHPQAYIPRMRVTVATRSMASMYAAVRRSVLYFSEVFSTA